VSTQQQTRAASRGTPPEITLNSEFIPKTAKLPGQVRFRDRGDIVNIGDSEEPVERLDVERQPHHPSVAIVFADGHIYDVQTDDDVEMRRRDGHGRDGALYRPYLPNEEEMLIRRMWDSREVADGGD
jgi:growth factor-regulated tyrosine kinase substrate